MDNNYINMQSACFSIYNDLKNDFLKEKAYKDVVTNHGIGGSWGKTIAWVIKNEILIQIGIDVASIIIVDVIRSTFEYYKSRNSDRKVDVSNSKDMIFVEGNLVLNIEIDGALIGSIGKENIDIINKEFIDQIKKDIDSFKE